ncbi:MAG: sorbosone dehydrogenase family protein [Pseudomonadota bacterium]
MRKHILIVLGLLVLLGIGGLVYLGWPDTAQVDIARVQGARPEITAPRKQLIPTVQVADAVGWGDAIPTPAPGLAVVAFAKGFSHPRWLYELPNGDVLVAESNSPPRKGGGLTGWVMKTLMGKAGAGVPSANRITLLRDTDGDGVADARSVFASGLNSPHGMTLVGDTFYVANTDALVRFKYRTGATKLTGEPETVVRYPGGGNHWARNVVASADGKKLYVSVGSASNVAEGGLEKERRRAMIIEVDPATKAMRVFGAGLRNANGMAWEPRSGRLWTVVNERDMLGSDIAPDYLTSVTLGDNFGWPWFYWGGYEDARVEPKNDELRQYSRRPDYALGPHVAALGLTFAQNARLGANFADGAFIGLHGSWNRKPVSGYKVVFVPFGQRGFPEPGVKPVDVLTDFLDKDGNARGRPVGVIVDQTGALLVADDVGNVVWRVAAK